MFSTRLERLRQFNRLAVLVAATLLVIGIALIAVWAVPGIQHARGGGGGLARRSPLGCSSHWRFLWSYALSFTPQSGLSAA